MSFRLAAAALAAVSALCVGSSVSQATLLTGTFGTVPFGGGITYPGITTPGTLIRNAPTMTFHNLNVVNTVGAATAGGLPNVFFGIPFAFSNQAVFSPITIALPGAPYPKTTNISYPAFMTVDFGVGRPTVVFSATRQEWAYVSANDTLNFQFTGTAYDAKGIYSGILPAGLSMNMTGGLGGTNRNYSLSFAVIPEPTALGLLAAPVAALARRRR